MSDDLQNALETLRSHKDRLADTSIQDLFDQSETRFADFSTQLNDLVFDFSKIGIDQAALDALIGVARDLDVEGQRDAMFAGEKINTTENRAVLHTALRNLDASPVKVDDEDVWPLVKESLQRTGLFANKLRSGGYQVSGGKVTDVVNIGIGGSDLGPKLVARALSHLADGPDVHFVSNVDPSDMGDTLASLDPKTTLFIVASKTFTTQETMANARLAQSWVKSVVGMEYGRHFVGLTTNLEAAREFGIDDDRVFGFWDWVGGRYSVWSSIGLSVIISIGSEQATKFLVGAYEADQHFKNAPLEQNIPVIMAMIGIWHRNICGYATYAMLPYDNRLTDLPRWLQQLDMESNGKRVKKDGSAVDSDTAPIVFGEPGTNGQHAFYQMLHQGTSIVPCDFLIAANPSDPSGVDQHELLVANCFAQSEALMRGRSLEEANGNPHRVFEGNRPSTTLIYNQMDAKTLGTILALYEHKIFVQGAVWGINSFDQWGVELGKELANSFAAAVSDPSESVSASGSTLGLLSAYHKAKN